MIRAVSIFSFITVLLSFTDNFPEDKQYIVTASILNVRHSPDPDSRITGSLKKGDIVNLITKTNITSAIENITADWYKIKYSCNKTGFVFSGFISELKEYKPVKDKFREQFCKNLNNSYQCASAIEKEKIKSIHYRIERINDSLIIKSANRGIIIFKDIPDREYYTFSDYIPELNIFIFEKHYREGGVYLILNETNGNSLEIWSKDFSASPDKTLMIVCSEDTCSGYYPNGIQIIDLKNLKIIREIKIADSFPSSPEWINNQTFQIKKSFFLHPDKYDSRVYYIQKYDLSDGACREIFNAVTY